MDFKWSHQPDSSKPKKLKTLALSVEFPGRNTLLHQFVLDNSDPNESGSEFYINAVLMSMADAPANAVNAVNGEGYTALHLTVIKNNFLMVKKLLSYLLNIDINARCGQYKKNTALHWAAQSRYIPFIEDLLDKEAVTDNVYKKDGTALCIAARSDNLDVVKFLLSKGADVNDGGLYCTPLSNAAHSKNLESVMFLVNSGADVNIRSASGLTPLHAAASSGSLEIVEFLMNNGADLNAKDRYRDTPFHYALYEGNLEILKFLMGKGFDLHARKKTIEPLIHEAVYTTVETVAFLIDQGADVNTADHCGRTLLHNAFRFSGPKLEILKFLISKGADLHAVDYNGKTLLHYAVCWKALDEMSCLMDGHADLDAVDEVRRRRTPASGDGVASDCLSDAISSASLILDSLDFCVSKGSDLRAPDKGGSTPLHHAVVGCIAAFLLDRGADVQARDAGGWTPLHEAAYNGRAGVVRVLLSRGADRNAKNKTGDTPLDFARRNENHRTMPAKWKSVIDILQNAV